VKKLKNGDVEVSVIRFPKVIDYRVILKIKAFRELFNLVSKYQIDIIHTDGPRNTFYAGIVAKLKRIPLVWHVRASNQDRYDRLLYNLSSKIILVADSLQSRFQFKDNTKKFITIHNGIDLYEFRPQEQKEFIREKYKIGNSDLLIAVTARIEKLKGQKYLIEAFGKLENKIPNFHILQNKIPNFHILLAGEATDSSYLKECQDKACEIGIKDRVIFPGQIEDVSQILNATDIFVLPSLFEAFPRSVIEAMAAGKPVIATNVGGCSEAFEDKISGFLVPARDSGALADKIILLAKSKNLREKIGSEARYRVEKMFEIGDKVKQTEKLYYEVF